jgi:hypothetical protein
MALGRIKGQEVSLSIVVDGEVQSTLTDIQSLEVTRELETTEEGYLGETSKRYDEFYKGYSGSITMHTSSPGVFDFMQAVQDRAQRRTPGTVINIKATLQYPSGDRRRVVMNDAFFDGIPLNFGSQTDYGAITLSFKGSNVNVI